MWVDQLVNDNDTSSLLRVQFAIDLSATKKSADLFLKYSKDLGKDFARNKSGPFREVLNLDKCCAEY